MGSMKINEDERIVVLDVEMYDNLLALAWMADRDVDSDVVRSISRHANRKNVHLAQRRSKYLEGQRAKRYAGRLARKRVGHAFAYRNQDTMFIKRLGKLVQVRIQRLVPSFDTIDGVEIRDAYGALTYVQARDILIDVPAYDSDALNYMIRHEQVPVKRMREKENEPR